MVVRYVIYVEENVVVFGIYNVVEEITELCWIISIQGLNGVLH